MALRFDPALSCMDDLDNTLNEKCIFDTLWQAQEAVADPFRYAGTIDLVRTALDDLTRNPDMGTKIAMWELEQIL